MSANPENFLNKTAKINHSSVEALPNSRKIFVQGSRKDIQVAMREVSLTDTPLENGEFEKNPPITIYDTSGPYTDPNAEIDIRKGLDELRRTWVEERNDTDLLTGFSSEYRSEEHTSELQSH